MTVGEKIRILRLHNNWTQKGLAYLVGVSEITIRNYETKDTKIRPRHLTKLAEVFQIDPSVLSDNGIATYHDVMQVLFFLRDKYGLNIQKENAVSPCTLNFENDSICDYIDAWYNKMKEIEERGGDKDEIKAWELLFPGSYADDCKVKLDMHRKRGQINGHIEN